jgi:hypothetical protein
MPPPKKIIKEFPREGDLQLYRLEKLHEFHCVRCQGRKKSKLVAAQGGAWSKLLCNGCYGLLQSRKTCITMHGVLYVCLPRSKARSSLQAL